MFRNAAASAALLLSLAACGATPAPTPNVVTNRAGVLGGLGEGAAFGPSGNSQGPVTANTGQSGTMPTTGTSRATIGGSPTDDSNSASARGNPGNFATPTTRSSPGATPTNDSNSASALGGPGTGPVGAASGPAARPGPAARRPAPRARPANANGAYMGGGMAVDAPATPR